MNDMTGKESRKKHSTTPTHWLSTPRSLVKKFSAQKQKEIPVRSKLMKARNTGTRKKDTKASKYN